MSIRLQQGDTLSLRNLGHINTVRAALRNIEVHTGVSLAMETQLDTIENIQNLKNDIDRLLNSKDTINLDKALVPEIVSYLEQRVPALVILLQYLRTGQRWEREDALLKEMNFPANPFMHEMLRAVTNRPTAIRVEDIEDGGRLNGLYNAMRRKYKENRQMRAYFSKQVKKANVAKA